MRMIIGTIMLLLLLPRVGYRCLLAWYDQKKVSVFVQDYMGLGMDIIQHRTITIANVPQNDIDIWFLYLKGKVNLIGPSLVNLATANRLTCDERVRFNVAPGILSPHQIKRRSGIAHVSERQQAVAFANNATWHRTIQLFSIWCIQQLFSILPNNLSTPASFELMGVTLSNITMQAAVARVVDSLNRERRVGNATKFAFVNADCANKYHQNSLYQRTLNAFDNVFADGIGVKIAARWQGIAVAENVNGTDMFPLLCTELAAKQKSVYLLGASNLVINRVAARLKIEYPTLKIAGYTDGFTHQDKPEKLCQSINDSEADLLLVALGAPRQEQWIADNAPRLTVNAAMGVGGLFDFYSGEVSRAPVWLRELSMEWVWRLGAQPLDKGKRYLLGNPLFLARAARAARAHKALNPATHNPATHNPVKGGANYELF